MQIPLLRETIAQLVYKVKGALAAHKCSSVFWTGNLKNRDIYGEEILSQTTSITGSNVTTGEADDESMECEDNDLFNNDDDRQATGNKRNKRQSSRPSTSKGRKRKLYPNNNDADNDDDDNDSSRSRCF